jgi:hypothetical protein
MEIAAPDSNFRPMSLHEDQLAYESFSGLLPHHRRQSARVPEVARDTNKLARLSRHAKLDYWVCEVMAGIKKSVHGGKRFGAGRKPSTVKGIVKKLPCFSAELILHEIKAQSKLIQLANCGEPAVELQAVKFLWEQAYGKAQQTIENKGAITLEHVDLSRLSDSELNTVRNLITSASQAIPFGS